MPDPAALKCALCGSTDNVQEDEVKTVSNHLLWHGLRCGHCRGSNIVPYTVIKQFIDEVKDGVVLAGEDVAALPMDIVAHVHTELKGIAVRVDGTVKYFDDHMLAMGHAAYGWWHRNVFQHLPWLHEDKEGGAV